MYDDTELRKFALELAAGRNAYKLDLQTEDVVQAAEQYYAFLKNKAPNKEE